MTTIPAKLSDIMDALESQSEESYAYLNKKTGKVDLVTDEELLRPDPKNLSPKAKALFDVLFPA